MEQLSLLSLAASAAPSQPEAPRCRMCPRSARWLTGQQKWAMYCAGRNCDNRERICPCCNGTFHMNVDGAGTKYCSNECKTKGYGYPVGRPKPPPKRCAWCDRPKPEGGSSARYEATRLWPYICPDCLAPIKHVVDRLKAHHVPHERAKQLIAEPGCEVCGANLLERARTNGRGKSMALLVVDHDHTCCPVDSHSCGNCVRGLLCHYCNAAAGQLKDNADSALALAKYLETWQNRAS